MLIAQLATVASYAQDYSQQGVRLSQAGKYADAVVAFRRALEQQPNNPELTYNLALAYFRSGEPAQTVKLLEGKLSRDGSVLALLGSAYRELGNAEQAVDNLRQAAALEPGNEDYVYDFAIMLIQCDALPEAAELLKSAPERFPNSAKMFAARGLVSFMTGHNGDAEADYKRAAKLEPNAADIQSSLGDFYAGTGEYRKAATAYANAERLAPRNAEYHDKAGRNYLKLGQAERAAAAFERALASNSRDAEANFELGKMARGRGDSAAAIGLFTKAVTANPNYREAYYQLSLSYQSRGEKEKAAAAMRRFRDLKGPDE